MILSKKDRLLIVELSQKGYKPEEIVQLLRIGDTRSIIRRRININNPVGIIKSANPRSLKKSTAPAPKIKQFEYGDYKKEALEATLHVLLENLKKKTFVKICINCNKEFETIYENKKYCSRICCDKYRHHLPKYKKRHTEYIKEWRMKRRLKKELSQLVRLEELKNY